MVQKLKILTITLLLFMAAALTLRTAYLELLAPHTDEVVGTILVWHSWEPDEALVLQEIIDKYDDLHPNAQVILTAVEPEDLLVRFEEAADIGFGPDLILGPEEWIYPLATVDLIRPIEGQLEESTLERYLPVALDTVRYQGSLYGLPLAVHTMGLYYNKEIISDPATTLDELVAAAQAGIEIGLSTSFENAFWGIRAFGGHLFNEERRVILDQGGFANWLNWLKSAQDIPAFILSNDQRALRTLFAEGRLGYLVDSSQAWTELKAGMNPDQVGVLPLPGGPTGNPAPFLRVESLLFSSASSDQQRTVALDLAQFLTNAEQQTTLMRRTDRIPANNRVRINSRLAPNIAAFAEQARSAVAPPLGQRVAELLRLGNDAYTRVLEGLVTPAEAASEATVAINQAIGLQVTLDDGYRCESVGDFTLWHTWDGSGAEALAAILDSFSADCPNIYIRTEQVDEVDLLLRLTGTSTIQERPDLLLLPHTLLLPLIEESIVRPLGPLLAGGQTADPALLQRYRPL
jgi:maltose-binding protein MalE